MIRYTFVPCVCTEHGLCYTYYGNEIVDAIDAVVPVLWMVGQIHKILRDGNISYVLVKVPIFLFAHRKSRGGFLVNAFHAHRSGTTISVYGGGKDPEPVNRQERL